MSETQKGVDDTKKPFRFRHGRIVLGMGMIILIGLSTAQIMLAAKVATTGAQIKTMEEEKNQLSLDILRLNEQIASDSALPSIENKARNQLGMTSVTQTKELPVIYITTNTSESLAAR